MVGGQWSCAAAVTAGIGLALFTAPGTAYADSDDTSAGGATAEHSTATAEHQVSPLDRTAPEHTTADSAGVSVSAPTDAPSPTDETADDDADGDHDDSVDDDESPTDEATESDPDEAIDLTPAPTPDGATRPAHEGHDEPGDASIKSSSVAVHTDSGLTPPEPKRVSVSAAVRSEPHAAAQIAQIDPRPPSITEAATVAAVPAPAAIATNPVKALIDSFFYVVNSIICPNPPALPTNPFQLLAYEFFRRIEIAFGLPVVGTAITTIADPGEPVYAPGTPSPADVAHTPYGDIGKWMLQPGGQISNWGGQKYGGRTLLEPINIIIVDPTSTSVAESTAKLIAELTQAGFPIQLGHSTGFSGVIDGNTYGQQPSGIIDAFADQFVLFPQDHARAFGPDPLETTAGYVWTLAVSREIFGFYGLLPAHLYVSFNAGRDNLATKLVSAGGTLVGFVPLNNAYDSPTVETGDTDGYAAVIRFND